MDSVNCQFMQTLLSLCILIRLTDCTLFTKFNAICLVQLTLHYYCQLKVSVKPKCNTLTN